MSVLDRVKITFADVLGIDVGEIQPGTTPDDVPAWDSVAHLNLILSLESEFAVEMLPEEIERALSVETVVNIISAKPHA